MPNYMVRLASNDPGAKAGMGAMGGSSVGTDAAPPKSTRGCAGRCLRVPARESAAP